MKKIYSLLLASALVFTSCSDFLDTKPQGKLTQDIFFGEEEGALMGINAIYSQMKSWDLIGFSWFGIMEVPSDNSDTGSSPADGSYARVNSLNDFTYDVYTSELNGWWTGNYKGIGFCNVALDNLDVLKDEQLKIRSIAQARFFRGFFYFNLVRTYGGVPLVTKVQNPDEYDQPCASEEAIYQQIIDDLSYAAMNLPTRDEWGIAERGRVTKGTAEGLLAKVYLFRQDYASVKQYAGQVISRGEYNLHHNYRDLFSPDSYYSDEVMLADQYLWGSDKTRDKASEYVKWQGVRGFKGWGFCSPSESLDKAYESGDPRREATIIYDGENMEGVGVINFKDEPGVQPRANKKTMWPTTYWNANNFAKQNCHLYFLRYADVLLMYAEACNELANGESDPLVDDALAKLELVRDRARKSGDDPTVLPKITERNKAKLREIIWNERRIELAMEGHRFFDLIRYKRADRFEKQLHGLFIYRLDDNGVRRDLPWRGNDEGKMAYPTHFEYEKFELNNPTRYWWTNGFDPKWYLSPFPSTEVNKGYGLVQNPGW